MLIWAILVVTGLYGQHIHTIAIGHESRQDDSPTVSVIPDGSAWSAWLATFGYGRIPK